MKAFRLASVLALSLGFSVAASAAPVTDSPGKNSVHVTESNSLNPTGDIVPLTGTIAKGKKKSVVEIQVTLAVTANASVPALYFTPGINGFSINPAGNTMQCVSGATYPCVFTATYWADLDALEAANPGMFAGQPLLIRVTGGNYLATGSGIPYTATLTARMAKK